MLKEHENPPITYPEQTSITEFAGQWWVAHTKSRNEKALAHDLIARDICYFLPMTLSITRRTRRTVKSLLPVVDRLKERFHIGVTPLKLKRSRDTVLCLISSG